MRVDFLRNKVFPDWGIERVVYHIRFSDFNNRCSYYDLERAVKSCIKYHYKEIEENYDI